MAAKPKGARLTGAHTAGIFSDMSVDGPEIGTLVLVVDRAKNLPNRKTIGKQDPYCAARLGKEAKKTTTDIRGGQTPRWDQELRFTVHDSPDYYQLKVSVFNDDRKTELIGETWVDLRDIIVSGGGQSDQWHNLNCRGKYAGEVRIEITFYDSRPKPEQSAPKPKPVASEMDGSSGQQRATPKRRPLPSDPVTGQSPSAAVPHHVQTPPRPQPSVPPAAPTPVATASPAFVIPNQSPLQAVEYATPPPQPRYQMADSYAAGPPSGGAGNYATPPRRAEVPQPYRSADRYERNDRYLAQHEEQQDYSPGYHGQSYDRYDQPDARRSYQASAGRDQYDIPPPAPADDPRGYPADDDRPPPPPIHRTRHNSGSAHDMPLRANFDTTPKGTPPTMRHDVLRSEAHRNSMSNAYPGRPQYRQHDSAPSASPTFAGGEQQLQSYQPRHHSYDSAYDHQPRSMQATVEDAPDTSSPLSSQNLQSSVSRRSESEDPTYDEVPSPAPLNFSGRGRRSSGQYHSQPTTPHHRLHDSGPAESAPSPANQRDYSYTTSPTPASRGPHQSRSQQFSNIPSELEDTRSYSTAVSRIPPPVPASLVPGMDIALALEISDRINEERRHDRRYTASMATLQRGRQGAEEISPGHALTHSPQPYSTPQHQLEQSPAAYSPEYSGGPSPSPITRREVSPNPNPNPNHTIRRKSISPAPPPDPRRLSGVPFSPDAYDALNPSIAAAAANEPSRPDFNEASGKIITHDGREIDPSDHLPMETWAPEPEPKLPKKETAAPARLVGAQPMPPSGRRPLRIAARPTSLATPPERPQFASSIADAPPPAPAGRNRLQKKANRASAMPALMSSSSAEPSPAPAMASGPLAPLPHHQNNYTPSRALVRAGTYDYPNENQAPASYGGSPGSSRAPGGLPPVPAKIPLMSGALPVNDREMVPWNGGAAHGNSPGRHAGGSFDGEMSLAEEMSRIDIGNGRARRHGHRQSYSPGHGQGYGGY